jgi:hypothetical protein
LHVAATTADDDAHPDLVQCWVADLVLVDYSLNSRTVLLPVLLLLQLLLLLLSPPGFALSACRMLTRGQCSILFQCWCCCCW